MIKRQYLIILLVVFLFNEGYAQKFDVGLTLNPSTFNRLGFDKPAIIFSDYSSADVGIYGFSIYDFSYGYPTLYGLLNSGIYLRYHAKPFYLKTELNYQTKAFRFSCKSYQFVKQFFYYSCIEVPLIAGIQFNPQHVIKYKLQVGVNTEIGKFDHASILSPFNIRGNHHDINHEFLDRMSTVVYYYHLGIGFDYYGMSVDLRAEKNINNLNKELSDYNANFTDALMIRLALGFRISGHHLNKKTQQLNKE